MKPEPIPEHYQKRLDSRNKLLGQHLKEFRFSEGMTQEEVSQEIELHRNTIIRAETGNNITLGSLFILADFYEISVSELLSVID